MFCEHPLRDRGDVGVSAQIAAIIEEGLQAIVAGARGGAVRDAQRSKAAIAVNVLVFVLEFIAIAYGIVKNGLAYNFVFYTELSNLFAGIACALCAFAEWRELGGGRPLSRTLVWLKFAASCCLLMTLFVVTFILTPMLNNAGYPGFYMMYIDGVKLVTHLGAPLVVTASYIAFEADREMTLKQSLIGFAPTLAYAAVAYPCNILRLWDGPYPFFQVWTMPAYMSVLWFAALFVLSFGLCQIPRLIARRYSAHG